MYTTPQDIAQTSLNYTTGDMGSTIDGPFACIHIGRALAALAESVVSSREADYGDVRPHLPLSDFSSQ